MRRSLGGDDKLVLQSQSAQNTGVPGGSRDLRDVDWRSRPGGSPSTAARPSRVVTRRSPGYLPSGAYPAGRVVAWLARHPRFSFHIKPTAASWTNRVTTWFGILSRLAIRRGTFESVRALTAAIERFSRRWNAGASPFTWVKTADEMLAKAVRETQDDPGGRHPSHIGYAHECRHPVPDGPLRRKD